MNILLSAYACEPNKGSEPGVGWGWAIELAKHHNVWVITRDNNEETITKYMDENPEYRNENLKFIYVGLSRKLTFWKKGRRGMRLFYMIWQCKAAKVAMEWHQKVHFDLVQHVTFVSYTQPTYMYRLGIPMIWGPISGGENIPQHINIEMNAKEKLIEMVRKWSQVIALITPSIRIAMKQSKYIIVATDETKEKIPNKYKGKTLVMPAIGIENLPKVKKKKNSDEKVRIIMAGRLIYWKAFDIGLKAFMQIADDYPNAELHILGEGNKKESLKRLAGGYLNKQIFFEEPVQHDQIFEFYQKFDIFLNTTLRDSGCMTMLEAMSVGLPCIAIATGGPKLLLDNFEKCQIEPTSYHECIEKSAEKLSRFIENKEFRKEVSEMQYLHSRNIFSIENKVNILQELYR